MPSQYTSRHTLDQGCAGSLFAIPRGANDWCGDSQPLSNQQMNGRLSGLTYSARGNNRPGIPVRLP